MVECVFVGLGGRGVEFVSGKGGLSVCEWEGEGEPASVHGPLFCCYSELYAKIYLTHYVDLLQKNPLHMTGTISWKFRENRFSKRMKSYR